MLQGIRTPPPRQKRMRRKALQNVRKSQQSENEVHNQNHQQESLNGHPHPTPHSHHRIQPDGIEPSGRRHQKCVLRKGYKKQCAKSIAPAAEPAPVMASAQSKCVVRKGYKKRCKTIAEEAPLTLADAHKARVQRAQSTAMSKLMDQIGKPYRWGGTSPRTGFDCSGLVYYAYKDLVKIRIPRTANEMYHLRDARPVDRGELQSGDLVFFRTRGRGTADHVGVYVGNGKFIQSPRTGRDIQITSLSEDYWIRHYVGARRVMTPKTIR